MTYQEMSARERECLLLQALKTAIGFVVRLAEAQDAGVTPETVLPASMLVQRLDALVRQVEQRAALPASEHKSQHRRETGMTDTLDAEITEAWATISRLGQEYREARIRLRELEKQQRDARRAVSTAAPQASVRAALKKAEYAPALINGFGRSSGYRVVSTVEETLVFYQDGYGGSLHGKPSDPHQMADQYRQTLEKAGFGAVIRDGSVVVTKKGTRA